MRTFIAACAAALVWVAPVGTAEAQTGEQVFAFTGAAQAFKVPSDVCAVTVVAAGAEGGGDDEANAAGGRGGSATATVDVVPDEVLTVVVGGPGEVATTEAGAAGGFNRGAAGGVPGGGGSGFGPTGTTFGTGVHAGAGRVTIRWAAGGGCVVPRFTG